MRGARTLLDPEQLAGVPAYKLLEAAAHAHIAVDHRFLHAILDRPDESIPDLVRFASEDHNADTVGLEDVLLDIFRYLRTPDGLPFLIELVRRDPVNVGDEVVEALAPLGAAAIDPLLGILREIEDKGEDAGEILFLLSQLRARDDRILNTLARHLAGDDMEASLFLDMYGDPAAIPSLEAVLERLPPGDINRVKIKSYITDLSSGQSATEVAEDPFDIWASYPNQDMPPLELLDNEERLVLFDAGSAELRAAAAAISRGPAQDDKIRARLLQLAKSDPDAKVRGECWESLEELSNEPEVRLAMLAILSDRNSPIEERCGAAIALAQHADNRAVFEAIEELYADPRGRAKALKAMGRSFDKRFARYPPMHLDDPDPENKRQAIWAVGYLELSAETSRLVPFLDDEEFRADALFAYALAVPADIGRGRIRSLMNKIDEAAGGFKPDEEEYVELAIDQRLVLHGKKPFFSADDPDEGTDSEPGVSLKVGRNDLCPCGSGKKYKKCCGR